MRILHRNWLTAITLLTTFALNGCALEHEHIADIEVIPATVDKQIYSPADAGKPLDLKNEAAETKWVFHCQPTIGYSETSRHEDSDWLCDLQVTSVKMKVSLSIVIYLPANASEKIIAHENGHVSICEKAYAPANDAASKAIKSNLGKTFSGKGKTLEAAKEAAIETASNAICRSYCRKTLNVANQVSRTYDQITNYGKNAVSQTEALQKSFSQTTASKDSLDPQ